MSPSARSGWRKALRPRVIIPVVLSLALLGFALSISDLGQVAHRIQRIDAVTGFIVFGLACGYLVVKSQQFLRLLRSMGIRPTWRQFVLAFAVGEMTLPVPSGIYMQNYVLRSLGVAGFALSAGATTLMLTIEVAVVAVSLAVVGVPGWQDFRLGVIALLVLAVAGFTTFVVSRRVQRFTERLAQRPRLGKLARAVLDLTRGVRSAATPGTLAVAVVLCVVYLATLVASLWAVGHGIGLSNLSFVASTSIYFFSLGAALLLGGLLAQLGVLEVAGIGVARAWGFDLSDALAMFLAFRILWMGSIWLVCGVALVLLWREFHSPRDGSHESVD